MRRRRIGWGAVAAGLAVFAAVTAPAQVANWNGLADTNWANAANWNGGIVPPVGGFQSVCIFVTNGANQPLYYTAAEGDTVFTNGTGAGSNRPLRIGDGGTGTLYITGGTLQTVGSAGDLLGNGAAGNASLIVDGGRYISTNATMLFGNAGVAANFTVNSGTALVATIQAASATAGSINLNGGLLQMTRVNRTGSMALTINLNGGRLKASSDQTDWLPSAGTTYNLLAGGAHIDTAGFNVGSAGLLAGIGGLIKTNGGTLTLGGANAYDGVTTVYGGAIYATNNTALGTANGGTVVKNGAYVRLGNGVTVANESLTMSGNGDNYGALQAAANATSVWTGPIYINDNGGTAGPRLGAQSGGVLTVSGPISNGVSGSILYISGVGTSGRVILSGANVYTGLTGIIRGVLALGAHQSLPSGTMLSLNVANIPSDASTFDMAGFSQTIGGLSSSTSAAQPCTITNSSPALSTLTVNQSANTFFSGTIGGNVALVKSGTGMLTLSNATSHTGPTTLNAGTLSVIANNGLGGSAVTVNGGALLLGTTGAVPGTITFTGGDNTAALGASYAIDQAFVDWAAGKVSGAVPVLVAGADTANSLTFTGAMGGTFYGGAGSATATAAAVWGDTTLRLGGGPGLLAYSAAIGGSSDVLIGPVGGNSASVVSLAAGNTYTGPTTIRSGTLRIAVDSSLGAAPGAATPGNIVVDGGALLGPASDISLSANRGIAIGTNGAAIGALGGGILRVPGVIADLPGESGVLTAAGGGLLVLFGYNTYSGGTVIPTGSGIVIQGNRTLGSGPVTVAGGVLRASSGAPANTDVSNAVILAANSILGGSNGKGVTYLGPITLSNGTRTVTMNGSDWAVFAGPVGDGGLGYGLTKTGSSTLTMTATNTYGGPTRITGGVLALAGEGSLSNSPLIEIGAGAVLDVTARSVGNMTLASGQTLSGHGTFTGGLITDTGSTVAPGASAGSLTMNGWLTMNAGSTFVVELNGLTAGTQYDQLAMGFNALTLGNPNLQVIFGYTPSEGDSFQIVTGLTGYDPIFNGTFAGKPDGSTFLVGSTQTRIDYNDDNITLTVVPEPASLAALGLLATALLLRRRR